MGHMWARRRVNERQWVGCRVRGIAHRHERHLHHRNARRPTSPCERVTTVSPRHTAAPPSPPAAARFESPIAAVSNRPTHPQVRRWLLRSGYKRAPHPETSTGMPLVGRGRVIAPSQGQTLDRTIKSKHSRRAAIPRDDSDGT